jgi:RNA polymerase sigma factor (sigma-70 family)
VEEVGHTRRGSVPAARVPGDGFEQFVRLHFEPLASTLALITMDRQLAAGATQEAFLRLHLRWATREELDDPVAWLYQVGINRCRDYRRQLRRSARLFTRLSGEPSPGDTGPTWLVEFDFTRLMKQLPRRQRIAAVLFYRCDLSAAEIAQVMQISEGAVKSHLHRARETLRPLVEAQ